MDYPRTTDDGQTVWACCESKIGPNCQHKVEVTLAEIAEDMLPVLRTLNRHRNPDIRHDVFSKQAEVFYAILRLVGWPKGMAVEALEYAMEHPDSTAREAMYATQTGDVNALEAHRKRL